MKLVRPTQVVNRGKKHPRGVWSEEQQSGWEISRYVQSSDLFQSQQTIVCILERSLQRIEYQMLAWAFSPNDNHFSHYTHKLANPHDSKLYRLKSDI